MRVAALRGQLRLLDDRLDGKASAGALEDLRDRFAELAATVAAALEEITAVRMPAPDWHRMTPEDRTAALGKLADWTTGILAVWYPDTRLAACWPNHPQAIAELGVIWAEWRRIYEPKAPELKGALDWHDRWLPDAIRRINDITKNCAGGCVTRRKMGSG